MAPPQETGEFGAITTGDPETGVVFPSDGESYRVQSQETDDVGEIAVGRPFDHDNPHESLGFCD